MNLPQRKLPRLKNYDYSSNNYYYVTICTADKQHLFWDHAQLSDMGRIAKEELEKLPEHYADVVDKFVVMPNHVHHFMILSSATIKCIRKYGNISMEIPHSGNRTNTDHWAERINPFPTVARRKR